MTLNPIKWVFDLAARAYRTIKGRWLNRRRLRVAVDEVAAAAETEMMDAARTLVAAAEEEDHDRGTPPLVVWQRDQEDQVKRSVLIGALVAAGGYKQFTAADREKAEEAVARQYEFLAAFAAAIVAGTQKLDGTLAVRAGMYAGAMISAYEDLFRSSVVTVYSEERRVLNSVNPCRDCQDYADRGWVPVGTLPAISHACECRGRCRCVFEYRLRRSPVT